MMRDSPQLKESEVQLHPQMYVWSVRELPAARTNGLSRHRVRVNGDHVPRMYTVTAGIESVAERDNGRRCILMCRVY